MNRYCILLLLCLLIWGCNDTSVVESPQTSKAEQTEVVVEEEVEVAVDVKVETGYIPFPKGYGYMENLGALQKATDEGNRKIIREHAWKLWAGIMQPAEGLGWPLWYTWSNTTAAFKAENSGKVGDEKSKSNASSGESLKTKNLKNMVNVDTKTPNYDLPQTVIDKYSGVITDGSIKDGANFQNNGDIMVATESLSQQAMDNIREKELYLTSTLDALHAKNEPINLVSKFIVTKHMYWPVKAEGITGVPVWKDNFPDTFPGYAGYEVWDTLVGIDPSGEQIGNTVKVEFLYGVKDYEKKPMSTVTAEAKVYGLDDFYYHKITQDDWDSFDEADKGILDAASYWANNQPIGVGDYLISIAMHVNTRELPSWTLQSVWWSDEPDKGQYAANRPELPQATGPWDHYLLTDDYAVPPNDKGELDIAVNPYIEGVIHPIATSCRNCHVRAGWPTGSTAGTAGYQNPDCPGLLTYLTPESPCLEKITLTDYSWIIPDRAISE